MKRKQFTEEQVNAINAKNARYHRDTSSAAKPESNTLDAAEKPDAFKGIDERVNITFIVYRRKLLDPDNHYSKHITDTIVSSGLLRNDTASEIQEVRYRQVKIPDWEQERTVVEITQA